MNGSATFGCAVRSECTKIRTLRSTYYSVATTVVFGAGLAALFGSAGSNAYRTMMPQDRQAFDPVAMSLRGYFLAQLVICVMGALVITSEHATGMIWTTMGAVPRRKRLLAAKATVLSIVGLLVGTVVAFASFFAGQAVLSSGGAPHAGLGEPQVLRAVVGAGLYLALVGLLGMAVGTLVRATAGALSIMVAVTLLVPVLATSLPGSLARFIATYWPTLAGAQIMKVHQDPGLLTPWAGLGLMCVAVAVVLAVAFTVFDRRDV
jgi:ABC-type transport system involved in multi-copper enzyme maturation permease subunit